MRVQPVTMDKLERSGRELLTKYEEQQGKKPILWEVLANHPPLLEAHAQFYENTIYEGNLDQELKEKVGVIVSANNDCEFCETSHQINLVELFGYSGEDVDRIANGEFEGAPEEERVAFEFAEQITKNPQGVLDTHVHQLREVGFSEQDIVELVGACAQFIVANVYADTLGISPDAYVED